MSYDFKKFINDNQIEETDGLMPAVFLGHGSPMNAIAKNDFTNFLQNFSKDIPTPKAIVCVSAHWETEGTQIQKIQQPKTIHDFYGFPPELYEIEYPAKGSVMVAEDIAHHVSDINPVDSWGIDHGTWSVLRHIYPNANIPTLQLSLNRNLNFSQHLELAKELRFLRSKGVLILGSGNITHNLRVASRDMGSVEVPEWAIEFDEMIKDALVSHDISVLLNENKSKQKLWNMAHPTLEHYLPLLYITGVSLGDLKVEFPFEGMQNGSLSMRSVKFTTS